MLESATDPAAKRKAALSRYNSTKSTQQWELVANRIPRKIHTPAVQPSKMDEKKWTDSSVRQPLRILLGMRLARNLQ